MIRMIIDHDDHGNLLIFPRSQDHKLEADYKDQVAELILAIFKLFVFNLNS